MKNKIEIKTEYIKLDSAIKFSGIAMTGGEAKLMIEDGTVEVNNEKCVMRGKKLRPGDTFTVTKNNEKITFVIG